MSIMWYHQKKKIHFSRSRRYSEKLPDLAWEGCNSIIKNRIEKGCSVNEVDKANRTALYYAAKKGNSELVSFLLEHDANPNIVDIDGRTALHEAVTSWPRSIDTVQCLLEQGAKPNKESDDSWTPIKLATLFGRNEEVETLIKYGADVDFIDRKGETALYEALNHEPQHIEIAKILSKNADNQAQFINAIQKNHVCVVRFLISSVEINYPMGLNMTPLMVASKNNYTEIVRILIANGAKINAIDVTGKSALIHAAINGSFKSAELNVRNKSKMNIADQNGKTALHYAMMAGHRHIYRLLVRFGADMTLCDDSDKSPIDYITTKEEREKLRFLRKNRYRDNKSGRKF